ncbi:nucleoside deaminase [Corynebacterium sp.]|uniref:nucleoside deaminase n=1 Tax=Corynebacterium sp. TaxID=1720 RepID=UPI0026DECE09|nr:nucleoside deaminase [Corynebacterium sp.]MDO5512866.1 nucleoside deaminase [Corynebacterium sp.]
MITDTDRPWLARAVDLAARALDSGDEPYGSVLVGADGTELFADHNRISGGDATRHPEFAIARWAAENLAPAERAEAVVYTSGEHCAMCSAAHGWVGLGRIVYAASSAQISAWRKELGHPPAPVRAIPIQDVVPGLAVDGPDEELGARVRELVAGVPPVGLEPTLSGF